jgi:hypothetical protein
LCGGTTIGRRTFARQASSEGRQVVAEQRKRNVQVHKGASEEAFVALREKRAAEFAASAMLSPSIQANVRASRFPRAELNGGRFLRIPFCLATGLAEVV